MNSEKFIKVGGNVYYESQLRLMSNKQLNDLIEECQDSIEDIAAKKDDYKKNNSEPINSDHFWEVINKFESASVYLQSDIILISKILKEREPENNPADWYEAFYKIASKNMSIWKLNKFRQMTDESVGFAL